MKVALTPETIIETLGMQRHPQGDRTLVGCTVAPGFEFSSFELAPPGWEL